MILKIKEAHHDTVVGFHNKAVPLGKRSEKDLIELGIIARESGHKRWIEVFEELPTLEELRRMKEGYILPQLPPIPTKPTEDTNGHNKREHIAIQPAVAVKEQKAVRKQRVKARRKAANPIRT